VSQSSESDASIWKQVPGLSSVKIVPISSIEIIRKGAHLPWGPLCVDTSLPPSAHI